ncbi:hypothetical protein HNW13_018530 [Shewanella sp. BF02_Schw]|uniref:hypothetical protein n=1 Tax=Shewanella sp. BF02_Schw TaxID=394908 RepID=UPI00177E8C05|nr:hypothetical protein [Shewanella sp. BF02_Schw]MBO1897738.1 hypothetical protein [Shewanella sp. BF02_Schw]
MELNSGHLKVDIMRSTIIPTYNEAISFEDYATLMHDWTKWANQHGCKLSTGENIPITFWFVMVGGTRQLHQSILSNKRANSGSVTANIAKVVYYLSVLSDDQFLAEIHKHVGYFEAKVNDENKLNIERQRLTHQLSHQAAKIAYDAGGFVKMSDIAKKLDITESRAKTVINNVLKFAQYDAILDASKTKLKVKGIRS